MSSSTSTGPTADSSPGAPAPPVSATAPPGATGAFVPTTIALGCAARLRPWGLKDCDSPTLLDGLMTVAADPQSALWNPVRAADLTAAAKWVELRAEDWSAGTAATFALLDGDADTADTADTADPVDTAPTLLGALTVRWTDRSDGLAMIGYWLVPAARGRGLATEATLAATEWAFRTVGVRRLELAHAVQNTPSCRVAQRCGFPTEGTLRASYRFGDGRYHDEHLHARLATDAPAT
ncbi:GNAT family N-acetyltransferase [Streptomyces sp. NPDC091272]|uniref:GNAT family N-acetyltransferase n=1 Tax=Streptomyces sp. NPDC091272 TaxID=3365981 RepID=UPI00380F66A9